jgi:hypothetical protein
MKSRTSLAIAAAALALGGLAGLLLLSTSSRVDDKPALAVSQQPGWTEVQWPFPTDQFGRGKAFRCNEAECGASVTLYVRAKIGFCNCATGVADDEELERISDFDYLGGKPSAMGDGRPIAVAWMKGRSRSYALDAPGRPGKSALTIGYNERCDAIVATVVVPHDRAGEVEANALKLLNGPTVMRWAELTLGL